MDANLSFEQTYVSSLSRWQHNFVRAFFFSSKALIENTKYFYITGHCLQICLFIVIKKFVSMHPLNLKTKA